MENQPNVLTMTIEDLSYEAILEFEAYGVTDAKFKNTTVDVEFESNESRTKWIVNHLK